MYLKGNRRWVLLTHKLAYIQAKNILAILQREISKTTPDNPGFKQTTANQTNSRLSFGGVELIFREAFN